MVRAVGITASLLRPWTGLSTLGTDCPFATFRFDAPTGAIWGPMHIIVFNSGSLEMTDFGKPSFYTRPHTSDYDLDWNYPCRHIYSSSLDGHDFTSGVAWFLNRACTCTCISSPGFINLDIRLHYQISCLLSSGLDMSHRVCFFYFCHSLCHQTRSCRILGTSQDWRCGNAALDEWTDR